MSSNQIVMVIVVAVLALIVRAIIKTVNKHHPDEPGFKEHQYTDDDKKRKK